eukprot:8693677-Pyramimonas_sp.AAC.1
MSSNRPMTLGRQSGRAAEASARRSHFFPRPVAGVAEKMGLKPGLAVNSVARDDSGGPWGVDSEATRGKAKGTFKSNADL